MKSNKFTQIPQPKNLDLVCVEYDNALVVGIYKGIKKGVILLDNAITLGSNLNANTFYMKGIYSVNRSNNMNFRWNGEKHTIPKKGTRITVSQGLELRNLFGYKNMYVGVGEVKNKLTSAGHNDIADIVSNYKP